MTCYHTLTVCAGEVLGEADGGVDNSKIEKLMPLSRPGAQSVSWGVEVRRIWRPGNSAAVRAPDHYPNAFVVHKAPIIAREARDPTTSACVSTAHRGDRPQQ